MQPVSALTSVPILSRALIGFAPDVVFKYHGRWR